MNGAVNKVSFLSSMIYIPYNLTNHNKGEVLQVILSGEPSQTHVAVKKYKQIRQVSASFLQNKQDLQNNLKLTQCTS